MFLAGADGKTPELRPPSIKGALRFWWRTVNGHLSLAELKKKETDIFGGGGEKAGRSKVIIEVLNQPDRKNIISEKPLPHKERTFQKNAIKTDFLFDVKITLTNEHNGFELKQVKSLFILFSILGGLGNRSRRGFGSFKINKIDDEIFNEAITKE
jgi:CRISPR-associated protein Cmr1